MPEGDTVFLAATRMHTALAGQRLVATDFRVPRFATVDLSGQTVREVAARTGRPCRRCGTPIRKADQPSYDADRVTYWCATCQPGPGPARTPRR